LKEEIEGLQTLSQGLLELFDQVEPVLEQAGLAEVYARAAVRLGELIEAERFLAGQRKDDGFEEFLARRLQIAKESGNEPSILPEPCNKIPPTPLIKAKSRALRGRGRGGSTKVDEHEAADAPTSVDGEKEDAAGEGKLTQGIASLRLVLRRTLRLALEAERPKERIYLTDVYRMVCGKLIALLKMEATAEAAGRSRSGVILEEVLKELLQEWGIQFEADKYSSSTSLN
jgi:hypothetical protein